MDYSILFDGCVVTTAKGIDDTTAINLQVGFVHLGLLEANIIGICNPGGYSCGPTSLLDGVGYFSVYVRF